MQKSDVQTVTVVPDDHLIIVNGAALYCTFEAPANLHALQWHADSGGHMEFTDDCNIQLSPSDATAYDEEVGPYVAIWEVEQQRQQQEAEAAEAARLAEYNSEPARFKRLREARDGRLAATDYLLMPDYPLDEETRIVVAAYRQALRDFPGLDGAPWDGGGEATPWPALDLPAVRQTAQEGLSETERPPENSSL